MTGSRPWLPRSFRHVFPQARESGGNSGITSPATRGSSTNSVTASEAFLGAAFTVLISRSGFVVASRPFAHPSVVFRTGGYPRIVYGALRNVGLLTRNERSQTHANCVFNLEFHLNSTRPAVDRGWRIADLIVARLRLKLAGVRRVGIGLSHGCNGVQSTRSKTEPQRSDALKSID